MFAVLAPGQGAQTPGMAAPWLTLPGAADLLDRFSAVIGLDLVRLGTTADAEEIKDTAVTQPLIVAVGLLAADQLGLLDASGGSAAGGFVAAGHSVGELTAAAVAGALTPEDAVALAARRGAEMAAACALVPTSMAAVLGGDEDAVLAAIAKAGLTAANRNAKGQIVAAGPTEKITAFVENPPPGARVRPLAVAGAFHTEFIAPAQQALTTWLDEHGVHAAEPEHVLLSNRDGLAVTEAADVLPRLAGQLTRPVRWDLCTATVRDLGITAALELPPAGTLTGIAKRELPGVELLALKSPDQLDAARTLITSRPQHGQGEHVPEWQVVVTAAKGVFTRADLDEGTAVRAGQQLGTVRTNRDEFPVLAPNDAILTEWLRSDDDIVAAGLPVARLHAGDELVGS